MGGVWWRGTAVTGACFVVLQLRVGSYRVLFEVEGSDVVIYRIRHRKDIYR